MNRSILIVICDFLLVSLLVFSSPDINRVTDPATDKSPPSETVQTNQPDSGREIASVMQLALAEERRNREQLTTELNRSRAAISERERMAAQNLQDLTRRMLQDQASLQQQYAAAQTNLQLMSLRLQSTSSETLLTKEKLAAMEAEARQKAEQTAALQQQVALLSQSNQLAFHEKLMLSTQLQVANAEKHAATEQVVRMTEEVKVEREEKAKLAEGVKVLATKSSELTQEIRENRPLAPNTIFSEFTTNRVQAKLNATRSGVFGGESVKRKEAATILVTDGTNIFALCHVQDTPLTFWNPGTEWEGLTGTLGHSYAQVPIQSLSFCWPDPRVVLIPVTAAEARQLGCKVYHTSTDPFKFQDAVLVGAQEGYYGECKFGIEMSTPDYVKLDNSFLKGLFGKFNPSRGDLVFSRTGELLGVMANGTYCMMIRSFDASATFKFGDNVRDQHTGQTLSALHSQVTQLPSRLQ